MGEFFGGLFACALMFCVAAFLCGFFSDPFMAVFEMGANLQDSIFGY